MTKSIQKLELENTTRLLYFRHRGNLAEVLKALREKYEDEVDNPGDRITIDFVEKVIKKFKKEEKVNSPFVATYIMDYVFMGTKQRELLWNEDDVELSEHRFSYRSACCDAAAQPRVNEQKEITFVCLKCEKICNAYRVPNLGVFETIRKLRVEQRNDEEQIVKAAEDLGFGVEKPALIKQTNYQLSLGDNSGGNPVKRLMSGDQQIVADLKKLPSMDREVVISRIRQNLESMDDGKEE